jgi:two-component system, chemotaxis family, chemotaxis protein CheY
MTQHSLPRFTDPFLLVDDDPAALDLCAKLMQRCGFPQVATAPDGAVALAMLRQRPYRAVLSDWNMPNMDGLALREAVRGDADLRELPFLLTSIDGSPERADLARQAGVSAFLLKPFDATTLRPKITEVLLCPRPTATDAGSPKGGFAA